MPRKVIYQCAVSLDGYIEDAHKQFDWCMTESEYSMQDFLASIDTILFGRSTYELMIRMGESFDQAYRNIAFGTPPDEVQPHCEWVTGPAADAVRALRKEDGKHIWLMGGARLAGSLANEGLVDELQLAVHPIVLGGGTPFFLGLTQRIHYMPMQTQTFADGLTMMTYRLTLHS